VTRALIHATALLMLVAALLASASAAGAPRVYAAQVPGGTVRVLVVVTEPPWPAGGLRIEDGSGTVLMPALRPDPAAATALDAAAQAGLAAFRRLPGAADDNARPVGAILALRLVSDWGFARAAGAAVELPAGVHPRAIRVVLLDEAGAVTATFDPVPVAIDNGPPAVLGLHADATASGIALRWQTPARADAVPAYGYTVERADGAQRDPLMLHPQLLTLGSAHEPNPFLDRGPPLETTLGYTLRLVDVLGVPGAPATAQIYSPDFAARLPPPGVVATAGRGLVTVTWKAAAEAHAAGFVVERSQLVAGPYELLTVESLPPGSTRFEDRQVQPGATYYYRVRALTAGGALGVEPDPVRAEALAADVPAAPTGLQAEVGASQVSLSWAAVPGTSIAGYVIERRATANAPRWTRLNARLAPEARYIDVTGPGAGGSFEYRVSAVAADEGVSKPSAILLVALRDSVPPPPPAVLATSGSAGHAEVRFAAAEPMSKTVQVALLRAESPDESGLVVGAPVAAKAGVITDDWVDAGRAYWYRLVAFDAAGNRSEPTDAYRVRVAAADVPVPRAPDVAYATDPAPQVTLRFAAPPAHVRILVQVERDDGRWRILTGPTVDTIAIDRDPPGPHARYRIVYVGENGGPGIPSPAAAAR
jgi:hypothetical protein